MVERAEIRTDLTGNVTPLANAIAIGEQRAGKFAATLGSFKGMIAGAFTVGAVVNLGRSVFALADQISEAAAITGLTTDQFQALTAATRDNGVEDEKVIVALSRLRDLQGQLANGNKAAAATFERLGLDLEKVSRSSTAQVLEMIGRKAFEAGGDNKTLSDIMDVLGAKSAPRMMAALQELGEKGFGGMIKSAREAGQVMDEAVIGQLKDAEDQWSRLWRKIVIVTGQTIGGLQVLHEKGKRIDFLGTPKTPEQRAAEEQEILNKVFGAPENIRRPRDEQLKIIADRTREVTEATKEMNEAIEETAEVQRDPRTPASSTGFSRQSIGGSITGSGDIILSSIGQRQLTTQERMARTLENIQRTLQEPPELPPATFAP